MLYLTGLLSAASDAFNILSADVLESLCPPLKLMLSNPAGAAPQPAGLASGPADSPVAVKKVGVATTPKTMKK